LSDGFGRILPDQFEIGLPLKAGVNVVLVGIEIKEPEFGTGLWMRLE
jgi:hypothetical protein